MQAMHSIRLGTKVKGITQTLMRKKSSLLRLLQTMMVKQLKISIIKTKVKSFGAIKVSAFDPTKCELPNESIPRPTRAQLRQQSHEIVAFIVFNMATFSEDGDPGCNRDNWNKKAPNATGPT